MFQDHVVEEKLRRIGKHQAGRAIDEHQQKPSARTPLRGLSSSTTSGSTFQEYFSFEAAYCPPVMLSGSRGARRTRLPAPPLCVSCLDYNARFLELSCVLCLRPFLRSDTAY